MREKLRWEILGTSAIARQQIFPAIRQSSNGIVAAMGRHDLARTKSYAEKFGVPCVVEAFADAVLAGTSIPYSLRESVKNLHVLDAIAESGRSGKAETVLTDETAAPGRSKVHG